MAAVTSAAVSTQSGTDAASYVTGSFTPAANDLLVVVTAIHGNTAADWNLTDSIGNRYQKIIRALYTASADFMEIWVCNDLAAATARTLTYSHLAGTATGGFLQPLLVSGMTRTGTAAVRSSGGQNNQAAAGTPAPVLSNTPLTTNPTVTAVANATNPAAVTVPAGFTSRFNTGHTAPIRGLVTANDDSGFVTATVTWGGTSATAFGSLAVELDASAAPANTIPILAAARR